MTDIIKSFPFWVQVVLFSVPVIGLLLAGIGLILNFAQSKRNNRQYRLSITASAFQKFIEDDVMQKIFYDIEYGNFLYDPDEFHGSKSEIETDRLLRHFSSVALYWRSGFISTSDHTTS